MFDITKIEDQNNKIIITTKDMINMYYADLKKVDIANGEGVRVSLFVSGCRHHCKGCFNEIIYSN